MTIKELKQKAIEQGVIPEVGGRADGKLMQNPFEISEFSDFILKNGVKNYLEIGTQYGGLLKYMTQVVGLEGWGIDPVEPTEVPSYLVYKNRSGTSDTLDWAKNRAPYDLIFVDGDHSYEAVKKDYRNYWGMVKKFMAFHDICGLRDCEGARDSWNEIKAKHKYTEFIADDPAYKVGIGVIWKE